MRNTRGFCNNISKMLILGVRTYRHYAIFDDRCIFCIGAAFEFSYTYGCRTGVSGKSRPVVEMVTR